MADLPFNHPDARAKRAAKIAAECDALMAHYCGTRKPTPAPQPRDGTVYFVGPSGGPIKIGFSYNLALRLRDLRTMNAAELIVHAEVVAAPTVERAYHRRFAAHRLHGEWFAPHPDILAEIERLKGMEA